MLGLKELIAIGVGGMIGGGIFSILGLAVGIAGKGAPLCFLVGGIVAMISGYSYVKLAVGFHSDGASFTFLEKAFPSQLNIAGIAGWTVIIGYIGTLALYAFTFGAYGSHLLGGVGNEKLRWLLSSGVLLFFMVINLFGVKESGKIEDIVVYLKIILLGLFGVLGLGSIKQSNLTPFHGNGPSSIIVAGALLFVAFEGFQLITNAVEETKDPNKNIPRGIFGSIFIATLIYLCVSYVALGNLGTEQLITAKEYALAVAAKPSLGMAGSYLIDIAALLATSSAINATLFGASRMLAEMATKSRVPRAFSFRSRQKIPSIAIITIAILGLAFTVLGKLEIIATFSSLVFMLISLSVVVANYRLIHITKSNPIVVIGGGILLLATIGILLDHLWIHQRAQFVSIVGFLLLIAIMEIFFFNRTTSQHKNKS